MPSASNISNNNNNIKLEKQNSVGSVHAGGGGGGPGGQSSVSSAQNPTIVNSTANNNNNIETSNNNSKEKCAINVGSVSTMLTSDSNNPMKQVFVIIEHKIRNLEKRKTKLESYREIQATGKELSSDQIAAVAKYDSVMATLEFARDLSKQMLQTFKDAEKEQKKQARKDLIVKAHAETAKIREVLVIQNILTCFTDDSVRADFLDGKNGAFKLEHNDLNALQKFVVDIQTRRPENPDDISFMSAAQKAAEYLSMTIDGRPKQYGDTTFESLRRIFNQIQECGYLDKIYLNVPEETSVNEQEFLVDSEGDSNAAVGENVIEEGIEKLNVADDVQQQVVVKNDVAAVIPSQQQSLEIQQQVKEQLELQQQQQIATVLTTQQSGLQTVPPANLPAFQPQPLSGSTTPVHVAIYPTPPIPAPPQPIQQVAPGGIISVQGPPPQMVGPPPPQQRQMIASPGSGQIPQGTPISIHGGPPPSHFPPTTVRAVEQSFFKQHQHQQYLQQMRPLAEVIGSGSFYFLQDSELDSPELGNVAANSIPVSGIVFEQQPQQLLQQPSQAHIIGNPELTQNELLKTQEQQQQQQPQPLIGNNMPQSHAQSQQPIPSQTFTNQSFPSLQADITTASNINNSTNNNSSTNQSQILLNEQHQQPIMMIARLGAPQGRLPNQQSQQSGDVGLNTAGFPFESPVVTTLSYEQQVQQQLAAAAGLQPKVSDDSKVVDETHKFNSDTVTDWEATLKNAALVSNSNTSLGQTNAAATAALTNALKPANLETNKWSAEMNSVATPPTSNNNSQPRKNEWSSNASSGNSGGGYGDGPTPSPVNPHESNHWNSNQQQDIGGYGRNGGSRGPNNYRRGDDRRDRDDRGRQSGGGGGNSGSGYRERSGYGNSSQNNRGSGNGTGIYFRNNDNSSTSSYYQNGGNVYSSGKDSGPRYGSGGGNYRGPRGGNTSSGRGNAPPPRSMGGRNTGSANSYINPRQPNRLPMGLENKN